MSPLRRISLRGDQLRFGTENAAENAARDLSRRGWSVTPVKPGDDGSWSFEATRLIPYKYDFQKPLDKDKE